MGIRSANLRTLLRLVLCCLIFYAIDIHRIQVAKGAQLWTKAGVRLRFDKKWHMSFDQRYRIHHLHESSLIPQIAFHFQPMALLRLSLGYRHTTTFVAGEDMFDFDHRLFTDTEVRTRIARLRLAHRLRLQYEIGERGLSGNTHLIEKITLRNQLKATYRLTRHWRPTMSFELFNRLNNSEKYWLRSRLMGGVQYRLGEHHRFGMSYRIQHALHSDLRGKRQYKKGAADHIFSITYQLRI